MKAFKRLSEAITNSNQKTRSQLIMEVFIIRLIIDH